MDEAKFKIKTYFKIMGDFAPDDVTALLGIQPDKQWKKGDARQAAGGQVYQFSMWRCGSVATKNYLHAEKQMEKTISPLLEKVELLRDFRQSHNVKLTLEVVIKFISIDEKPTISPSSAVIDFCHATATELDYDYQFLFDVAQGE